MTNIPLCIHVTCTAPYKYNIEFPVYQEDNIKIINKAINDDDKNGLGIVLEVRKLAYEYDVNLRNYSLVVDLNEKKSEV